MRRPRTEARPGDWMTQKGLTNRGPLQKPDLLFELLIIALDTPTQFGEVHELAEGNVFRPSIGGIWRDEKISFLGACAKSKGPGGRAERDRLDRCGGRAGSRDVPPLWHSVDFAS